ncbi:MAG: hydroxymethylbilane synthase [Verrucomicrobia bacterium]|nr:hydroxymethylbilane synthase [Verrucomicrobiota bacterium]
MSHDKTIVIATRGSALALAQTNGIADVCRSAFPDLRFEIKIIKTTGDKLQSVPASASVQPLVKGLFTKELEVALLNGEADFAVHSLKDLPTELPDGLTLAAVTKREDVRDVLIYRDAETALRTPHSALRTGLEPHTAIRDFPDGATIATSSTRRQAQLLAVRPDLKLIPVRGNVGTRLRKLAERGEFDGLVLAAAGLNRLQIRISAEGKLTRGKDASATTEVPEGLLASHLPVEEMLPCVGQGAIGIEARNGDERIAAICRRLDDAETHACVLAERAFLRGMGGGCLSPIAALAEMTGDRLRLRGVSFQNGTIRRGEVTGVSAESDALGARLAAELKA